MTRTASLPPMLVSVTEFGRSVGVGRTKAYELVDAGAVRTVSIGARRLVPVCEVERYVAELLDAAGIERATAPVAARGGADTSDAGGIEEGRHGRS